MAPQIVLLRGINIGPRNRVAMPELRKLFTGAGFEDVRTYVQSGNVVLRSELDVEQLARECERLIASQFGLEIPVIVRTRDELAVVVERNPLAAVAVNPSATRSRSWPPIRRRRRSRSSRPHGSSRRRSRRSAARSTPGTPKA